MNRLKNLLWETQLIESGSAVKLFKPEEVMSFRIPGFKSRDKLIDMPIDDFLSMAKPGESADKAKTVKDVMDRGEKFETIPYLVVRNGEDPSYLKVTGHEGRHRARILKTMGYTTIPVILIDTPIRWSEQNDSNKRDYKTDWPEELEGQNSTKRIPFPVDRKDALKPAY